MDCEELKKRTKKFALEVIKLAESFPRRITADIIARQLIKSATSVGANYRSACKAQSRPHFISKMNIVLEEADESLYWLELLIESGLVKENNIKNLVSEASELIAIFTASIKTARKNKF